MKWKSYVCDRKYVNLFLICLICLFLLNGVFSKKKTDVYNKSHNQNTILNKKSINKIENYNESYQSIKTNAAKNKKYKDTNYNQIVDSKSHNKNTTPYGKIDSKTFHYLSVFDRKSSMYNGDSKKLNSQVRKKYYRKNNQ